MIPFMVPGSEGQPILDGCSVMVFIILSLYQILEWEART